MKSVEKIVNQASGHCPVTVYEESESRRRAICP